MKGKLLYYFNKILNYLIFCVFLIPIPFAIFKGENYVSLFFKISIPIFVLFYSIFWILINKEIKVVKKNVDSSQKKIKEFENREHLLPGGIREFNNRVEILKKNLSNIENLLEHINKSLRVFAIISALISILNAIFFKG